MKLCFALIFVCMSSVGMASGFNYNCSSETNLKIFKSGNSNEITIQINNDNLAINNKSEPISNLAPFKTLKHTINFEGEGLVGIADIGLASGKDAGGLVIIGGNSNDPLLQQYNCTLR